MSPNIPDSKCYLTTGPILTKESELEKRRPYSTLLDHVFQHQVDLIIPDEVYEVIKDDLHSIIGIVQYHRIFMPLGGILEKDFYTKYVRMGNVLMLSDGRIDVDDVFCLYDGILYLSVRKETYEKAGLVGVPAVFGGRGKERWTIRFNLRESFMVHGCKAFDRLKWSCEEVFTLNQRWLFCDLNQPSLNPSNDEDPTSFAKLKGLSVPTLHRTSVPMVATSTSPVKIPALEQPKFPEEFMTLLDEDFKRSTFLDWAMHVHEWFALASVFADRLPVNDNIDPYLSRYDVERCADITGNGSVVAARKLTRVRWKGFLPSQWTNKIFRTLSCITPPNEWFAITVHGFANAPISWRGEQHSALAGGFGGENIITVMALPVTSPAKEGRLIGSEKSSLSQFPAAGNKSKKLQGDAMEEDDVDESTTPAKKDSAADASSQEQTPATKRRFMMWEVVGGRDEHS